MQCLRQTLAASLTAARSTRLHPQRFRQPLRRLPNARHDLPTSPGSVSVTNRARLSNVASSISSGRRRIRLVSVGSSLVRIGPTRSGHAKCVGYHAAHIWQPSVRTSARHSEAAGWLRDSPRTSSPSGQASACVAFKIWNAARGDPLVPKHSVDCVRHCPNKVTQPPQALERSRRRRRQIDSGSTHWRRRARRLRFPDGFRSPTRALSGVMPSSSNWQGCSELAVF